MMIFNPNIILISVYRLKNRNQMVVNFDLPVVEVTAAPFSPKAIKPLDKLGQSSTPCKND
jgi:hypothetical protein